jgi:hypothetical protein
LLTTSTASSSGSTTTTTTTILTFSNGPLVTALARSYIVVATLAIVTMAMTLGSWVVVGIFLLPNSISCLLSLWVIQCTVLVLSVCVASNLLSSSMGAVHRSGGDSNNFNYNRRTGNDSSSLSLDIFHYTLGFTVVRHATIVGAWLVELVERMSSRNNNDNASSSSSTSLSAAVSPSESTMSSSTSQIQLVAFGGRGHRLGSDGDGERTRRSAADPSENDHDDHDNKEELSPLISHTV